ncbi:iron-containing alcohol dehydrogenase [bacterium]|nr:iron-containing alcohol dehydrogenase [bacterium]
MREFTDLDSYLSSDPSELAASVLHCPACGRDHKIPFQVVRSGRDMIAELPEVIQTIAGGRPEEIGVIYDRQIEAKLEDLFFAPFSEAGLPFVRVPVGEVGRLLVATTALGDQVAEALPSGVDFLVSVGSGVISDLTKWAATQRGLPFVLMGTAGSMNAYTSITGSMTVGEVKTSKWLDPANAVMLDSDLLASAPPAMTAAGVGDLLARSVANADWKLSELLRGTYFCPVPFRMMADYQQQLLGKTEALSRNELPEMDLLGRAVLASGYSMTVLDGETSPSSGSEHILSHFFDFQHTVFDRPKHLHGAQVGMGTIIMAHAYELLREMGPDDFDLNDIHRRRLSLTALRLDHRRVFGDHGEIFNQVVAKKRVPDIEFRAYVTRILTDWDAIWAEMDPYLVPAADLQAALTATGAETKLNGLDRSKEDAVQALLYGSHYRPRYTILDLFWELGLFPQIAPEILERAGVLD